MSAVTSNPAAAIRWTFRRKSLDCGASGTLTLAVTRLLKPTITATLPAWETSQGKIEEY
jgi:hypothetical protein